MREVRGHKLAQKEFRKKETEKLKEIVLRYLEKITEIDKQIKELQEHKRYLKMDIEDLKFGRLDRIEERMVKDSKAKKYGLMQVKGNVQSTNTEETSSLSSLAYRVEPRWSDISFYLHSSTAKFNTIGTYSLSSGEVVNLR